MNTNPYQTHTHKRALRNTMWIRPSYNSNCTNEKPSTIYVILFTLYTHKSQQVVHGWYFNINADAILSVSTIAPNFYLTIYIYTCSYYCVNPLYHAMSYEPQNTCAYCARYGAYVNAIVVQHVPIWLVMQASPGLANASEEKNVRDAQYAMNYMYIKLYIVFSKRALLCAIKSISPRFQGHASAVDVHKLVSSSSQHQHIRIGAVMCVRLYNSSILALSLRVSYIRIYATRHMYVHIYVTYAKWYKLQRCKWHKTYLRPLIVIPMRTLCSKTRRSVAEAESGLVVLQTCARQSHSAPPHHRVNIRVSPCILALMLAQDRRSARSRGAARSGSWVHDLRTQTSPPFAASCDDE